MRRSRRTCNGRRAMCVFLPGGAAFPEAAPREWVVAHGMPKGTPRLPIVRAPTRRERSRSARTLVLVRGRLSPVADALVQRDAGDAERGQCVGPPPSDLRVEH